MQIGDRIKRLRKERGYTQEQLGNLIGVQKSAVQKYEKGTIKNIKPEIITKLCQIFDISPIILLDMMNDTDRLHREVRLLDEIQAVFGHQYVNLLGMFLEMNEEGQSKLIEYAKDLHSIERYSK